MIILGIDPGTARTGYGIVEKNKEDKIFNCLGHGLIQTDKALVAAERLKIINNKIDGLIRKYRPDVLAMETVFFFRNLKTALPVSRAGGVILLTAAKKKVPVREYTPLQVKLTITGYGWAEKELVQKKVKKLLKLKDFPKSDDTIDALAIAITHIIKEEA